MEKQPLGSFGRPSDIAPNVNENEGQLFYDWVRQWANFIAATSYFSPVRMDAWSRSTMRYAIGQARRYYLNRDVFQGSGYEYQVQTDPDNMLPHYPFKGPEYMAKIKSLEGSAREISDNWKPSVIAHSEHINFRKGLKKRWADMNSECPWIAEAYTQAGFVIEKGDPEQYHQQAGGFIHSPKEAEEIMGQDMLNEIMRASMIKDISPYVAREGAIAGVMATEIRMDNGMPRIEQIPIDELIADLSGSDPYCRDMRYAGRIRYMAPSEIAALYGNMLTRDEMQDIINTANDVQLMMAWNTQYQWQTWDYALGMKGPGKIAVCFLQWIAVEDMDIVFNEDKYQNVHEENKRKAPNKALPFLGEYALEYRYQCVSIGGKYVVDYGKAEDQLRDPDKGFGKTELLIKVIVPTLYNGIWSSIGMSMIDAQRGMDLCRIQISTLIARDKGVVLFLNGLGPNDPGFAKRIKELKEGVTAIDYTDDLQAGNVLPPPAQAVELSLPSTIGFYLQLMQEFKVMLDVASGVSPANQGFAKDYIAKGVQTAQVENSNKTNSDFFAAFKWVIMETLRTSVMLRRQVAYYAAKRKAKRGYSADAESTIRPYEEMLDCSFGVGVDMDGTLSPAALSMMIQGMQTQGPAVAGMLEQIIGLTEFTNLNEAKMALRKISMDYEKKQQEQQQMQMQQQQQMQQMQQEAMLQKQGMAEEGATQRTAMQVEGKQAMQDNQLEAEALGQDNQHDHEAAMASVEHGMNAEGQQFQGNQEELQAILQRAQAGAGMDAGANPEEGQQGMTPPSL
jgi:hypothetical protein